MSNFPRFMSINDLWLDLTEDLLKGDVVPSRNGDTREIFGWGGTLLDPTKCFLTHPRRRLSAGYASAELLWYLLRRKDAAWLTPYAPQYSRFAEPDGTVYGAYGARWNMMGLMHDQLVNCFRILSKDRASRQAVITHWVPEDTYRAAYNPAKDIPCTLSLQFLVRDGRLNLQVTMRSNDAWLGTPYDIFCFSSIQILMAVALGLEVGSYNHCVASMHLYETTVERTKECLKARTNWCEGHNLRRALSGLTPTLTTAVGLILGDDELASTIMEKKCCLENDPDYTPTMDDPWLADLFWAMKGKIHKQIHVPGEMVRTDLAIGALI